MGSIDFSVCKVRNLINYTIISIDKCKKKHSMSIVIFMPKNQFVYSFKT